MSLFGKLFGGQSRALNLDHALESGKLPDGIRVVESDDFGALVIEIDNATVYPSGAVSVGDRLIRSDRFHLPDSRGPFTDVIEHSGRLAAVIAQSSSRAATLALSGPRIATLGALSARTAALIRVDDEPLEPIAERCGVRIGARTYAGGAAHSADTVVLARIPAWPTAQGVTVDIAQRNAFVAMMAEKENRDAFVYLEDVDATTGEAQSHTNTGAMRSTAVREGFRLIAPVRRPLSEVIAAVRGADVVMVESPAVVAYAQFATPGTKIVVFAPKGGAPADIVTDIATAGATIRFLEADDAGVVYLDTMETAIAWSCGEELASPYKVRWEVDGFVAESPQPIYMDREVDITVAELPEGVERVASAGVTWRAESDSSRVFRIVDAALNAVGSVLLPDGTSVVGESIGVPAIATKDGPMQIGTIAEPIAFAPGSLASLDSWRDTVLPRLVVLHADVPSARLAIAETRFDVDATLADAGIAPSTVTRFPSAEIDGFVAVPELYIAVTGQGDGL